MFESVVTAVLNKFLGDYVANLEQNQLNLGIFSGNVVLTELQLKKEALDKLNLPVEVFFGHLGRLELHIPWRNLKSEPVKVIVEDLFLLAGPRVETEYDPAVEEERIQKAKQERLETAEIFQSSVENKLSQDMKNESFTTQLVTKIVDNLQVIVNNIHIRFEDSTSNPQRLFSFGVTLKTLSAVSTDEEWNETFLVNPQEAVHKLVNLDSFSLYWNTREGSMRDLSYEEFVEVARERIGDEEHAYILKPVSGIGKVVLNKFIREGTPKTLLNVLFDAFGINVNYEQYYDILCALAALSTAQRALPYRKYRPTGDGVRPIDLFKFAGTCFQAEIHERNRRRTWAYVMQRRVDRKEYVNLFSNKIILGSLNAEDSARLGELERRLEFDDIMHYRALARAFAKKSQASTPKSYGGWVMSWLGFRESAKSDLVKEEDIRELYETIDFDASAQAQENLATETQMLKVNFELGEGSFSLSEEPTSPGPIASFVFTGLTASLTQRPSTVAFVAALRDLVLVENLVPESHFKELIKVKPAHPDSPTSEKPLLFVAFDQMAKNPDADAELDLVIRPLQITVNLLAAERLVSFLLNKRTLPLLEALRAEAQRTFEKIEVQTRANMQKALEEHKGLDLRVKLDAPVILFPEDPTDLTKALFVADLGRVRADTELVSAEEKRGIFKKRRQLTEGEMEDLHDLLYDTIRVKITRLAVYFTENVSAWWEISAEREIQCAQSSKILEQVDINVDVETSIMPSAADLAKIKVQGVIPELLVYLSDRKMEKALSLLKQVSKMDSPPEVAASHHHREGQGTRAKPGPTDKGAAGRRAKKSEPPSEREEEEFYDAFDDMGLGEGREKDRNAGDGAAVGTRPGFVDEVDPLVLVAKILIERIRIIMSETVNMTAESQVLSLTAEGMGLNVVAYGLLNKIDFYLGSLALRDHLSPAASAEGGGLIIDGAQSLEKSLLSLSLRMVNPLNPEFATTYEEVERLVSIEITSFDVLVDPDISYGLAKFAFKKLLPLFAQLESEPLAPSAEVEPSSTLAAELLTSYQPRTLLSFAFNRFSVNLMGEGTKFAVLAAQNFTIDMVLVGERLSLSGEFLSLSLEGLLGSEYRRMLYFEGDSVLDFSFATKCKELSADSLIIAGSNIFELSSGQMYILAEADVLSAVLAVGLKFLKITELLDMPDKRRAMAGEAAPPPEEEGSSTGGQKRVTGADNQLGGLLTYLRVKLQSPIILVPSADQSLCLGLHLGSLQALNRFLPLEEGSSGGGGKFDQIFDICLQDTYISLSEGEDKPVRFLLEKFSVPLSVRLSSDSRERNFADVEVDSEIETITAGLTRADFTKIMCIVDHVSRAVAKLQAALPKPSPPSSISSVAPVPSKASATVATKDESRQSDGDASSFPLDVKVLLPQVRFTLKDAEDRPKVELAIDGISASVVSHTARGMGIEVGVGSVAITDLADPTQYYRDLFCIGGAAEGFNEPLVDSKRQLLVRIDQAPDGSSVLNVYVESPRVFLLFDTIFYLQSFFTLDDSKDATSPTATRSSPVPRSTPTSSTDSSAATTTITIPAAARGPSGPMMQVLFNMVDATVLIVESPAKMETEAVALRVGSVTFNMGRDMALAVDEISCFVFSTASPESSKVDLIDNLSATVALTNGAEESYLDVTLQPLSITVSFQDLQLFQSFADSMSKAQAKYAAILAAGARKETDATAKLEGGLSRIPTAIDKRSRRREKGLVNIHGIRAVLIDDSLSTLIPLLDVGVEEISCLIEDWSSVLQVSVAATVKANFYNPSLSYWEPLIEPWSFCLKIGPSEVEPTAETVIMLASEGGLEVLAVQHSIERLLQMFQKLSVKSSKAGRLSRKLSSPYLFTNLLTMPIQIGTSDPAHLLSASSSPAEGSSASLASRLKLSPGDTAEFAFEDWKQSRSAMLNVSHRIRVEVEGFEAFTNVKIDQDGFQKLRLEAAGDDKGGDSSSASLPRPRKMYMQTYLEEGVRHIVFREAQVVINETPHRLLLFFEGSDNGQTMEVASGRKICVPPSHTRSHCLLMVGEAHVRFTESVDLSLGEKLGGTIVGAQMDEQTLFHVMLACRQPAVGKAMDIHLVAPCLVENLLPMPIQIKLAQEEHKTVYDIGENAQLPIYSVDPKGGCTMAVSIPSVGLFSTNECPLGMRMGRKEPSILTLQDEAGLELKLLLNAMLSAEGQLCLSVAACYVIINQTEMTLQVQSEAYFKSRRTTNQIFTVPPAEDGRPYVLFSHPDVKSVKNRVRLRIADSNWSDAASFEAVGAECELSCKSMLTEKWYNVSGYVSLGSGKFAATKIIYISARYFAVNDTDWPLELSDSHTIYTIPPKSQIPFNVDPSNIENIMVRREGEGGEEPWMAPFDIRNVGSLFLRPGVHATGSATVNPPSSAKSGLIRVGRSVRTPSYYLTFAFTESWPFVLRNRSTVPIKVHQRNVEQVSYTCDPHAELNYTWDQPNFNDKRLVLSVGESKELMLDLAEIGKKSRVKVKRNGQVLTVLDVEIKAQGPAVLVLVVERRSLVGAMSEATNEDEVVATGTGGTFSDAFQSVILLRIPHIAVSLLSRDLEEFLLLYVKGLEVRYAISEQFVSYGLTVKWLQVDNQCFDYDHPMLLYPAVLSKAAKELESHPFLSLGIIQSKDRSYGVTYYKYFGLLLQEMAIEVGEELLRRVLAFVDFSLLAVQKEGIIDEQDFAVAKFEVERDSSDVLFFEFFQMHPIKVSVTFSRTEGPTAEKGGGGGGFASYNPMTMLVDVLTMTVGNISDAPLKFNALVLENILARQSALQETVIEHYKQEGITQVHKIIGSADFLGNPVGLVSTLGSGVTDLFYEPYQGLVSDRPQDVGIGLARGGLSLARKTISGFTGTFSKFTGSLAKGLSAATLDTSYQQRRRTAIARNKPKHAISGVSTGAMQLYSGVKSGITGVVDKPWEGAKEGGVGGFFKGVGVGLVGVVTKPVVGLIDMTTSLTEGIKSSADDSTGSVTQVRFPRVVPWDGKIRSYDMREAFGQSIMVSVSGEDQIREEFYVAHLEIPGENSIVILTSKRLQLVSVDRMKMVWQVRIEAIQQVSTTIDSIIVRVLDTPPRSKVIPILDQVTQQWFVGLVKQRLSLLLG